MIILFCIFAAICSQQFNGTLQPLQNDVFKLKLNNITKDHFLKVLLYPSDLFSDPGTRSLTDLFISNTNDNPNIFDNNCSSQKIGTDYCVLPQNQISLSYYYISVYCNSKCAYTLKVTYKAAESLPPVSQSSYTAKQTDLALFQIRMEGSSIQNYQISATFDDIERIDRQPMLSGKQNNSMQIMSQSRGNGKIVIVGQACGDCVYFVYLFVSENTTYNIRAGPPHQPSIYYHTIRDSLEFSNEVPLGQLSLLYQPIEGQFNYTLGSCGGQAVGIFQQRSRVYVSQSEWQRCNNKSGQVQYNVQMKSNGQRMSSMLFEIGNLPDYLQWQTNTISSLQGWQSINYKILLQQQQFNYSIQIKNVIGNTTFFINQSDHSYQLHTFQHLPQSYNQTSLIILQNQKQSISIFIIHLHKLPYYSTLPQSSYLPLYQYQYFQIQVNDTQLESVDFYLQNIIGQGIMAITRESNFLTFQQIEKGTGRATPYGHLKYLQNLTGSYYITIFSTQFLWYKLYPVLTSSQPHSPLLALQTISLPSKTIFYYNNISLIKLIIKPSGCVQVSKEIFLLGRQYACYKNQVLGSGTYLRVVGTKGQIELSVVKVQEAYLKKSKPITLSCLQCSYLITIEQIPSILLYQTYNASLLLNTSNTLISNPITPFNITNQSTLQIDINEGNVLVSLVDQQNNQLVNNVVYFPAKQTSNYYYIMQGEQVQVWVYGEGGRFEVYASVIPMPLQIDPAQLPYPSAEEFDYCSQGSELDRSEFVSIPPSRDLLVVSVILNKRYPYREEWLKKGKMLVSVDVGVKKIVQNVKYIKKVQGVVYYEYEDEKEFEVQVIALSECLPTVMIGSEIPTLNKYEIIKEGKSYVRITVPVSNKSHFIGVLSQTQCLFMLQLHQQYILPTLNEPFPMFLSCNVSCDFLVYVQEGGENGLLVWQGAGVISVYLSKYKGRIGKGEYDWSGSIKIQFPMQEGYYYGYVVVKQYGQQQQIMFNLLSSKPALLTFDNPFISPYSHRFTIYSTQPILHISENKQLYIAEGTQVTPEIYDFQSNQTSPRIVVPLLKPEITMFTVLVQSESKFVIYLGGQESKLIPGVPNIQNINQNQTCFQYFNQISSSFYISVHCQLQPQIRIEPFSKSKSFNSGQTHIRKILNSQLIKYSICINFNLSSIEVEQASEKQMYVVVYGGQVQVLDEGVQWMGELQKMQKDYYQILVLQPNRSLFIEVTNCYGTNYLAGSSSYQKLLQGQSTQIDQMQVEGSLMSAFIKAQRGYFYLSVQGSSPPEKSEMQSSYKISSKWVDTTDMYNASVNNKSVKWQKMVEQLLIELQQVTCQECDMSDIKYVVYIGSVYREVSMMAKCDIIGNDSKVYQYQHIPTKKRMLSSDKNKIVITLQNTLLQHLDNFTIQPIAILNTTRPYNHTLRLSYLPTRIAYYSKVQPSNQYSFRWIWYFCGFGIGIGCVIVLFYCRRYQIGVFGLKGEVQFQQTAVSCPEQKCEVQVKDKKGYKQFIDQQKL